MVQASIHERQYRPDGVVSHPSAIDAALQQILHRQMEAEVCQALGIDNLSQAYESGKLDILQGHTGTYVVSTMPESQLNRDIHFPVSRAFDVFRRKPVVLKKAGFSVPDIAEKIEYEARVLSTGFQRTNHVVKRVDYVAGESPIVVMEYVGSPHYEHMPAGVFSAGQVIQYGQSLITGAYKLARSGIIVQDAKPDNVTFATDGSLFSKWIDFADARLVGDKREFYFPGTAEWMNPETAGQHLQTLKSLFYTLTSILYFKVTDENFLLSHLPINGNIYDIYNPNMLQLVQKIHFDPQASNEQLRRYCQQNGLHYDQVASFFCLGFEP
ncbi:hypothetical protein LRY60_01105 [Candidatus Woesebacteria bacterium]|nr:hypothetical protein [Candidatus Woesebacteria bacterium]